MKYWIKIQEKTYEVELSSLHDRPILAKVDGVTYEVWVEDGAVASTKKVTEQTGKHPTGGTEKKKNNPGGTLSNITVLRSPIPGVIISISIQPGDQYPGQGFVWGDEMKTRSLQGKERSLRVG
jgi:biotin carboxyl carrier protein